MIKKICLKCKKEFIVFPSIIKKGGGKYCSRKCYDSSKFKGGSVNPQGYIRIYVPALKRRQMQHRIVMEKFLNRKLKSYEKIHHKNGIKNDNSLKNLEIVMAKKHFSKICCPFCQKEFLLK
jgi:hypothetical protein